MQARRVVGRSVVGRVHLSKDPNVRYRWEEIYVVTQPKRQRQVAASFPLVLPIKARELVQEL